MISLSDFQVGQTVVISGDRYYPDGRVTTVAKVGRKYVTTADLWQTQFYAGYGKNNCLTEKTEYGAPRSLYPSEEAYRQAREKSALENKLRQAFDWSKIRKLSYEQLKRIDAILEESQAEED